MSHRRFVSIVLFSGLVLSFTACSNDKLTTYPVSGNVTKAGKPVEGAAVLFFPQGGSQQFQELVPPRATTGPDGSYQLATYSQDDGAPSGAYKVTITWNAPPRGYQERKSVHDFADDDPEAEQVEGSEAPDLLRGQYGDPATTPLLATVGEEETQIPAFDLK
jgi:hypothetical protein